MAELALPRSWDRNPLLQVDHLSMRFGGLVAVGDVVLVRLAAAQRVSPGRWAALEYFVCRAYRLSWRVQGLRGIVLARRLGIDPAALERLCRYDWRGNVRELSNVLERAVLMSDVIALQAADIERVLPVGRAASPVGASPAIAETVAVAEREAIRGALRSTQGNKSRAARVLGISRKNLYERLRRAASSAGTDQ